MASLAPRLCPRLPRGSRPWAACPLLGSLKAPLPQALLPPPQPRRTVVAEERLETKSVVRPHCSLQPVPPCLSGQPSVPRAPPGTRFFLPPAPHQACSHCIGLTYLPVWGPWSPVPRAVALPASLKHSLRAGTAYTGRQKPKRGGGVLRGRTKEGVPVWSSPTQAFCLFLPPNQDLEKSGHTVHRILMCTCWLTRIGSYKSAQSQR